MPRSSRAGIWPLAPAEAGGVNAPSQQACEHSPQSHHYLAEFRPQKSPLLLAKRHLLLSAGSEGPAPGSAQVPANRLTLQVAEEPESEEHGDPGQHHGGDGWRLPRLS